MTASKISAQMRPMEEEQNNLPHLASAPLLSDQVGLGDAYPPTGQAACCEQDEPHLRQSLETCNCTLSSRRQGGHQLLRVVEAERLKISENQTSDPAESSRKSPPPRRSPWALDEDVLATSISNYIHIPIHTVSTDTLLAGDIAPQSRF